MTSKLQILYWRDRKEIEENVIPDSFEEFENLIRKKFGFDSSEKFKLEYLDEENENFILSKEFYSKEIILKIISNDSLIKVNKENEKENENEEDEKKENEKNKENGVNEEDEEKDLKDLPINESIVVGIGKIKSDNSDDTTSSKKRKEKIELIQNELEEQKKQNSILNESLKEKI